MTATLLAEKGLNRSDLPLFHELPQDQQTALWDAAQLHFEAEMAYFSGYTSYTNLAEICESVEQGILVPVTERPGRFGIARPVRDRYDLRVNRPVSEESVPYLHRKAATVLDFLAEDFHGLSRRDAAFYAILNATGQELALNRNADEKTFVALGKLLPRFKVLLRQVVSAYQNDGTVMAIEEVPQGWGGWHIAVKGD